MSGKAFASALAEPLQRQAFSELHNEVKAAEDKEAAAATGAAAGGGEKEAGGEEGGERKRHKKRERRRDEGSDDDDERRKRKKEKRDRRRREKEAGEAPPRAELAPSPPQCTERRGWRLAQPQALVSCGESRLSASGGLVLL